MSAGVDQKKSELVLEAEAFIQQSLQPQVNEYEEKRCIPREQISLMAEHHLFSFFVPECHGKAQNHVDYGMLCRAAGRVSGSVLSLITVSTMVTKTLVKWGNAFQKERWLKKIATGECIAAFAISEPLVGSDAANPQMNAVDKGNHWELTGTKKWISGGQVADLFLVSSVVNGKTTCFFVERELKGVSVKAINDVDGFRAAMLAEITFDKVKVPKEYIVGSIGIGFSVILNYALSYGRLSIAWGALGIAESCLVKSIHYTKKRAQFSQRLDEQPIIQQKLSQMITNIRATSLTCLNASLLMDKRNMNSPMEVNIAKYLSSKTVVNASLEAMRMHGAQGLTDLDLQRYKRDAHVISLIEGSDEIQEMMISQYGYEVISDLK